MTDIDLEAIRSALDFYGGDDRFPTTALIAAVQRRDDALAAFTAWRDSMAADLPDEYREEGAAVEVGIEDCYVDGLAAMDALAAVLAVHANYFDTSVPPVDACPEPEDVWRYDRDFRAAITAHLAPADNPTTEEDR